jgi:hypothetical protein
VQSSGQKIALNLSLGSQGCTGTMGIDGQGSFVLLKIGKSLWIKPDDKFWKHAAGSDGSALVDLVSGKYIKPSAKGSSLASIGALCDPAQFAKSFGSNMTGMVKGTTATIAGQPALQIKDSGDAASAYVTVDAKPEFLRLDGGGSNGKLDFTDYNSPARSPASRPEAGRTRSSAMTPETGDRTLHTVADKLLPIPSELVQEGNHVAGGDDDGRHDPAIAAASAATAVCVRRAHRPDRGR